MEQDTRNNFGLDHRILLKMLNSMDIEFRKGDTYVDQKIFPIKSGVYFVMSFVCSSRGDEEFILDCGD